MAGQDELCPRWYSSVRAPGLAIYQPNDLQSLYYDRRGECRGWYYDF